MIIMTGNAFRHGFPLRAVARYTVRFYRHENVGCLTALCRLMTKCAIKGLLCFGINLVFAMIEPCLGHPAINQYRFCDSRRSVGDRFYFVAERAAVERRANDRGPRLRLVWTCRKKDLAFQLVAGVYSLPQLGNLPGHKALNLLLGGDSLAHGEIGVLRRQRVQETSNGGGVAVRQCELGILGIELEGVTRLAVRNETDPLHIAPIRLRRVAIIAIQLPAVHERNVAGKMALMIEAHYIRVAHFCWVRRSFNAKLKFRMAIPE